MQPIHASAVAFDGRAVLIIGASGRGKSTLAIQLVGLGGVLVADDRVITEQRGDGLWLSAPDALVDRIEARGFGILACKTAPARAVAVVDMDQVEMARLPESFITEIAGVRLPCFRKVESPAFPIMLRLYLAEGLNE